MRIGRPVRALLGALALASGAVGMAADGSAASAKQPEEVYGSHLMTPQERAEHRNRLRSARSSEEREKIRAEHQQLMKERARQRGLAPPQVPASMGGGVGPRDSMDGSPRRYDGVRPGDRTTPPATARPGDPSSPGSGAPPNGTRPAEGPGGGS